jgi:pimeloyl-ACP methyl ester carboxylesterase
MPHANVGDLELFYEVVGDGEPLVCVQGLASDMGAWALQLDAFSDAYRTIVFDNRDVGRSSAAEAEYDIPDMAADVLGLADALGLERFHLLGASLGSAMAQHVALAAPARVATLTLAATWAGTPHAYSELRATVWEREVRRSSREELLENMLLRTISEDVLDSDDAIDGMKAMATENPHPQSTESLIRQIRAMSRHDVRDRLGELAMPVHVIAGARDVLIPPWKSEEVAELIPGAALTMIRDVGHALNAERAGEFNRAVLAFLGEHPLNANQAK